ncbi:NCAIR mutase-related protein [Tribonema minus]|uniref:phosphoribosylaminoimidazole carboxylase n=1 Tax=Tribonema minus TaxID=303371 RepID=A0A835ZD94_9STRA|nr:NCAIR mutase-related protein [Tribonema minus]
MGPAAAVEQLEPLLTIAHIGDFAKIDHHRTIRTGFPEVVYGEGKTPEQIRHIMEVMIRHRKSHSSSSSSSSGGGGGGDGGSSGSVDHAPAVASRICSAKWSHLQHIDGLQYYRDARLAVYHGSAPPAAGSLGTVAVMCAGTSDVAIAEETAVLLELCGAAVERVYDVGVAGIHRLFAALPRVRAAHCAVCIAGMDGAMPSVVAGLVRCPVVAVPTSVGYGAAFGGVAPLLTMLNACAPGVAVVNIDNGFGAAAMAVKILRMRHAAPPEEEP